MGKPSDLLLCYSIILWLIRCTSLPIILLFTATHVSGTRNILKVHAAFIHGYSLVRDREHGRPNFDRNLYKAIPSKADNVASNEHEDSEEQSMKKKVHTSDTHRELRRTSKVVNSLLDRFGISNNLSNRRMRNNYSNKSSENRPDNTQYFNTENNGQGQRTNRAKYDERVYRNKPKTEFMDNDLHKEQNQYNYGSTKRWNNFKDNSRPNAPKQNVEITQSDMESIPLLTPGIRDISSVGGNLAENKLIMEMQKKGFCGIVDPNSLFSLSHNVFDNSGSTFESIGIYDKSLLGVLNSHGITKPTITQKKNIPRLIDMFKSQSSKGLETCFINAVTGSGKTLAYLLPIMQHCLNSKIPLQSLDEPDYKAKLMSFFHQNIIIFCTSAELSIQTRDVFNRIYSTYESIRKKKDASIDLNRDHKSLFSSICSDILDKNKESPLNEMDVTTHIVPIVLFTQANAANQGSQLKSLQKQQNEDMHNAMDMISQKDKSKPINRRVGLFLADFKRAHLLAFVKRVLSINDIKYAVIDEYDGHICYKKDRDTADIEEGRNINEVIQKFKSYRKYNDKDTESDSRFLINLSASNIRDNTPYIIRDMFKDGKDNDATYTGYKCPSLPDTILHTVIIIRRDSQLYTLKRLLCTEPYEKSVMIFCSTPRCSEFLHHNLPRIIKDTNIDLINKHQGRLRQKNQFMKVMQKNIQNTLESIDKETGGGENKESVKSTRFVKNILISDSRIARGIDLSGFTHLINYDVPHDINFYLHLSGRIGRAGNPGIVINMVEHRLLPAFTRAIANRLPKKVYNLDFHRRYLCIKAN
ncbi:DEAD box ATP-dependent RNA helicase family member protein [Theileria equi strain WA]|uniref:ATP-dependent RNA helicase n=1 Tax=Theileria equi strain WA TaxID=1537102 RepID=L0AZY5_THEEQ|nr:DEAD box ATP-dependent RNA helicase family member protein [Theileria equi strain WA]AFZ80429.1 DEAD box ATP-dependent RNA helicase family member protein [Theileria equi strain WA]|eukprot:XP_004830095.1 DEAD box ATP-dependent RNA helicase family member protein [Theileria equi strain WA]